uniref:Uncharacterized protein n=1 Tax=Candidatus Kentrum sp. LPFa TaxID=2126335 RepID=A0A450VXB0_9GAMM|nr:MAG: hypothetical protein BECKLPF1236B_GA0070989_100837 [Candidatus Kentron sp. LPFa]
MSGKKKYLHCYAERKNGVWQAFCLDFLLAAQGESFEETKAKLTSMIKEYVYDAEHGENKKYAKQLLSRRAPMLWWGKYFLYMALSHLGKLHNETFARWHFQQFIVIRKNFPEKRTEKSGL